MSEFRETVLSGAPLIGTFLGLGSPLAAEACAMAGLDWLVVDLEHGSGGEGALPGQLIAASAHDVPTLVRVELGTRTRIGRALDLGAAGVVLPRVESRDEVEQQLSYCRYPPYGVRGVATYVRACAFGLDTAPIGKVERSTVGVVQIETLAALASAQEIAALDGTDVLFVGPRDLTHALEIPGDTNHPLFAEALTTVVTAARENGAVAGILAGDIESAQRYLDLGFTFVGVGSDSSFIAMSAKSAVEKLVRPASTSVARGA